MYKLFKFGHGNLHSVHLRNPKFLAPISHLHSGTLAPPNPPRENELRPSYPTHESATQLASEPSGCAVQISHPWPEWVELMDCLFKRGYFDQGDQNPVRKGESGPKDSNRIRTACLNFARDRSSLLGFMSKKDVQVVAGCGCPSIDRKVVNSGKRLRAHVGVDEGDVCSSCNSRGDCERAYVKAHEDEGGRTVDVMRLLLTYGLDPLSNTMEIKPSLNKKVKESVRRLLKEMVEYSTEDPDSDLLESTTLKTVEPSQEHSVPQEKYNMRGPMKQGDWLCPKCKFHNFAKNFKCLRCDGIFEERLARIRENQDNLPLRKGDWLCDKCNFFNFAKNGRCLMCKEKPLKRQLNPGEWECDSCNYINFRKNMLCLKCDHRRPKTYVEPVHEDGVYGKGNRASHVGARTNVDDTSYAGRVRGGQYRGADRWRFVDEENHDCRFVDFPIAGGKTELSHNPQKRDRWKLKMLERSKGAITDIESDDEFRSPRMERAAEYSTDDEEMAEWFGGGKRKTQRIPS